MIHIVQINVWCVDCPNPLFYLGQASSCHSFFWCVSFRRTFDDCFQSTLQRRSSTSGVRESSRNSPLMLMVRNNVHHLPIAGHTFSFGPQTVILTKRYLPNSWQPLTSLPPPFSPSSSLPLLPTSSNLHQLSAGSGLGLRGPRLHQVLSRGDGRSARVCQIFPRSQTEDQINQ